MIAPPLYGASLNGAHAVGQRQVLSLEAVEEVAVAHLLPPQLWGSCSQRDIEFRKITVTLLFALLFGKELSLPAWVLDKAYWPKCKLCQIIQELGQSQTGRVRVIC